MIRDFKYQKSMIVIVIVKLQRSRAQAAMCKNLNMGLWAFCNRKDCLEF
jgi:hypothetical protein